MQHDAEKNCIRQFYDESRELLREFVMERFQKGSKNLASEAVDRAESEMDENCFELVDAEVARQSVVFQEQMENTLKNLEFNEKDRMEEMKKQCLNAMDLQSHLMLCRQIAEMMLMMTVEKKHWSKKIEELQQRPTELENEKKLLKCAQPDQSNSIKYLLKELMHRLDDLDVQALDGDEKKIYDKIYQISREKLMERKQENAEELFFIQEPTVDKCELSKNELNRDWIEEHDTRKSVQQQPPYINVKWEKLENEENFAQTDIVDGSFASSVFNRFTQPQNSIHPNAPSDIPQIESSIIGMVKNSKYEERLHEDISAMIHDVIKTKLSSVDPSTPAANFVPMPKVESLKIRDSLETLAKRVS